MNRRRLLTFGVALAGALLALLVFGSRQQTAFVRLLVDAALLVGSMLLLRRLPYRTTVKANLGRLAAGVPLYLLAIAAVQLLHGLLGASLLERGLSGWLLLLHLPIALGLAWSLLVVLRLDALELNRRRRSLIVFAVIAVALALAEASESLWTLWALGALLFAVPMKWVEQIEAPRRGWVVLGLLVLVPFAFSIFFADVTYEPVDTSLTIGMTSEPGIIAGSLLEGFKSLLGLYWLLIPLRLLVALFQGSFGLRIPIRLKLGFTYLFSTLLPGLLLIALVAVALYAGIGTMRAHQARRLMERDLAELAALLERGGEPAKGADSVLVALYERRRSAPAPSADPAKAEEAGADTAGEQEEAGAPEVLEHWILTEKLRGSWDAPDTLPPWPQWNDSLPASEGLRPIGGGRVALAAVRTSEPGSPLVRVALEPLDRRKVRGWAAVVGARLVLEPGRSLAGGMGRQTRIQISSDPGQQWEGVEAIASHPSAPDTVGLLDRPLYHGVTELRSLADDEDEELVLWRGQLFARTTLRELVSSLYANEGLSRITLIVLGVLALLLLFAILFSSLLGFGITRSITASVKALRNGTERLRQGELETTIQVRTSDELGDLAQSFNHMTTDLRRMLGQMAEKERLEQEVQIARHIQLQLLPESLPRRDGIEIAARSDPALEVGGDYYDALDLGERGVLVALGDVSGKGVGAAILMSNLQANLHVLAVQGMPLEEMAAHLNRQIWQNSTPEMFITFFMGLLDPRSRTLSYINCGHDTPMLLREGEVVDLDVGGVLLGATPDAAYEADSVVLEDGDLVVCYSDGLTEAMDEGEREFGRERLIAVLEEMKEEKLVMTVDGVMKRVREYAGLERAARDDLTMLAARLHHRDEE